MVIPKKRPRFDSMDEKYFGQIMEWDKNSRQFTFIETTIRNRFFYSSGRYKPDFIFTKDINKKWDLSNYIFVEYKGYHKNMKVWEFKKKFIAEYCKLKGIGFIEVKRTVRKPKVERFQWKDYITGTLYNGTIDEFKKFILDTK